MSNHTNASTSTPGMCHFVMAYKVHGPGYSLFGLFNSVCLVFACCYLLYSMQAEYIRAYEANDGPLQRLLRGFDNENEDENQDHQHNNTHRTKTKAAPRLGSNSSSSINSGSPHNSTTTSIASTTSSASNGVVLPAYYVFCMGSCFTFILQAVVWIIPPYTVASEIGIACVFSACMVNDFLLLVHLNRPVGASARQSLWLAVVPSVVVLLYVVFVLKGAIAPESCHFCCVHFPKPGIEVPWLICGLVALWIGVCAEFRRSIVPAACGRAACGRTAAAPIPRKALAPWAALVSVPYLMSSIGIFVLHYHLGRSTAQDVHSGSTEDLAYCALVVSDLVYSLGYAPIFLYTVTRDSDDCRIIRMRRALQNALGGSGSLDHNLMAQKQTEVVVVDIVTDPRLNLIDPTQISSLSKIGSGGFGDVYRAVWHSLPVAVKKLKGIDTKCGNTLRELANEAGMLAELRHPNVVLFLGVIMTHDYCAVVTEFMSGGSVRDVLDHQVLIPTRTATPTTMRHSTRLLIMRDTARGMVHLHAGLGVGLVGAAEGKVPGQRNASGSGSGNEGSGSGSGSGLHGGVRRRGGPVIHRDMKTQNLLVDNRQHPRCVKVCDFGLSTCKDRFLKKTLTAVGTPQYAAPEVLRSDQYSEKADIYSFGVVVWELFQPDGKFPFEDMHALRAAHEVAYSGLRPQPDCSEEATPAWVRQMIQSCWVSDPSDRPSFVDMLKTIEREFNRASAKSSGVA